MILPSMVLSKISVITFPTPHAWRNMNDCETLTFTADRLQTCLLSNSRRRLASFLRFQPDSVILRL